METTDNLEVRIVQRICSELGITLEQFSEFENKHIKNIYIIEEAIKKSDELCRQRTASL